MVMRCLSFNTIIIVTLLFQHTLSFSALESRSLKPKSAISKIKFKKENKAKNRSDINCVFEKHENKTELSQLKNFVDEFSKKIKPEKPKSL